MTNSTKASLTKAAPLFSLCAIATTPGALDLLDRAGINATTYLVRHQCGDFGSLSPCDMQENHVAVRHGGRVLSAYEIDEARLWIITEADRSVSTLLLPWEY